MVSFHFDSRHAENVFMKSGALKCYSKHFLFNLGIVLLVCGKGSGSISNGVIILYEAAPNPLELASMDNLVGLVGLKYFSTGALVISSFRDVKLFACSACQCHSTFFSKRARSGEAI